MMTAKLIQRNNTSGCAFGRVFPTLDAGASEASRERQQQEVEEEGEGVTGRQWHECEMPTGDIRVPVSETRATSSSSLPQRHVRTSVGGAGGANEGTPKPYPEPYPPLPLNPTLTPAAGLKHACRTDIMSLIVMSINLPHMNKTPSVRTQTRLTRPLTAGPIRRFQPRYGCEQPLLPPACAGKPSTR